jgi:hypothetical protein
MDYKLEVVVVPVSDVDAAKSFYERIGYHTSASPTSRRGAAGLRFPKHVATRPSRLRKEVRR